MTKLALCIKELDTLKSLITNEVETIPASLVDREICENPENELLQIIPYGVFYTTIPEKGKLEILQYRRAVKKQDGSGVNEERLAGALSVGFGGHIDNEEDIVSTSQLHLELIEGQTPQFELTKKGLEATIENTLLREIQEELGIDAGKDYGVKVDETNTMYFMGREDSDVNKVHLAAFVPIHVSVKQLQEIKEKAVIQEDEIVELDIMGINFGAILTSFNVNEAIGGAVQEISTKYNVEDWSVIAIETLTRGMCAQVINVLQWEDMFESFKKGVERIESQHQEAQEDEAIEEERLEA